MENTSSGSAFIRGVLSISRTTTFFVCPVFTLRYTGSGWAEMIFKVPSSQTLLNDSVIWVHFVPAVTDFSSGSSCVLSVCDG